MSVISWSAFGGMMRGVVRAAGYVGFAGDPVAETRSLRKGRIAGRTTIALVALAVAALALLVVTGAVRLRPVLSGSMRPDVQPGDLAVTQRVSTSALRVGDVIVFYPPGTTNATMHRIAHISRVASVSHRTVTTVTTIGDANRRLDPWGPVTLRGDTVYRLRIVVPYLGWATEARFAGPLLITAAGLLLALSALQSLSRAIPGLGRRRTTVSTPSRKEGEDNA